MANNNEQWTRVILLLPPAPDGRAGRGLSESLQAQFAARDWFAIHANDPYQALAELCLREKSQISRAAWGLQRLEQLGLVVLEPRDWERHSVSLSDLTHAIQRYVPDASVWHISDEHVVAVYQPAPAAAPHAINRPATGASVARRSIAMSSATDHCSPSASPAAALSHAPPSPDSGLRYTAASAIAPAPAIGQSSQDDDFASQTRLSREELEMLLDPIDVPRSEVAS